MAVWLFAYGTHNVWQSDTQESVSACLTLLNSVPLNELAILHSIAETRTDENDPSSAYPDNYRNNFEAYLLTKTDDELGEYRTLMGKPDATVAQIVDHFIAEAVRIQQDKRTLFEKAATCFANGSAKAEWQYEGNGLFLNRLCFFQPYDGLRLRFINDLVWISGPFAVFSYYGTFLNAISVTSRYYYHQYFSQLFRALGSNFILYAHEWSGLEDEDDPDFNLAKLNQQSDWEKYSSHSIHTMGAFYRAELS